MPRPGLATQGRQGEVRPGGAWFGEVGKARRARQVLARRGGARYVWAGAVGLVGIAVPGLVGQSRQRMATHGESWYSFARQTRCGGAWFGALGRCKAGKAEQRRARSGSFGQGRRGGAWRDAVRSGAVGRGRQGEVRRGLFGHRRARQADFIFGEQHDLSIQTWIESNRRGCAKGR